MIRGYIVLTCSHSVSRNVCYRLLDDRWIFEDIHSGVVFTLLPCCPVTESTLLMIQSEYSNANLVTSKVFAAVASQFVFIYRTYAICGRNRTTLTVLLVIGVTLSIAEIVSPVVVPRSPKLGPTGNCVSDLSKVNLKLPELRSSVLTNVSSKGSTSWIQYLVRRIQSKSRYRC